MSDASPEVIELLGSDHFKTVERLSLTMARADCDSMQRLGNVFKTMSSITHLEVYAGVWWTFFPLHTPDMRTATRPIWHLPRLKHLDIDLSGLTCFPDIRALELQHIEIRNHAAFYDDVVSLFMACPALVSIDSKPSHGDITAKPDARFTAALRGNFWPDLRQLELDTFPGLLALSERTHPIHTVDYAMHDDPVQVDDVIHLFKQHPEMESLSVWRAPVLMNGDDGDDDGPSHELKLTPDEFIDAHHPTLSAVGPRIVLPALHNMNLRVSGDHTRLFGMFSYPNLRDLVLDATSAHLPRLDTVFAACPCLESLWLRNATMENMENWTLSNANPSLRQLVICSLSTRSLQDGTPFVQLATHLPNLETLGFEPPSSSLQHQCVNEEWVKRLVQCARSGHLQRLQHVWFRGHTAISETVFRDLCGALPYLESAYCKTVDFRKGRNPEICMR